jgi:hypothetical protein
MDGRSTSASPWDIIINLRPGVNGYESAPCPAPLADTGATGRLLTLAAFRDSERPLACYVRRHTGRTSILIDMFTADGCLHSQSAYPYSLGTGLLMLEDWDDPKTVWNTASLAGRLFIAGGSRPYCIFNTGDFWMRSQLAGQNIPAYPFAKDREHIIWPVTFTPGINSANWPYVTGSFHAGICAAHTGYMFWAGFAKDQLVSLDRELTADQQFILKEQVVQTKLVLLGPQWLVWSDRDNPFSIASPSRVLVPSRYAIRALCSMRDRLVIVTENDVWCLMGQTSDEFVLRQVSDCYGAQDATTICATPHGVVFAGSDGIFITDGDQNTVRLDEEIEHLFSGGLDWHALGNTDFDQPWCLSRRFGQLTYWAGRDEVWIPVAHVSAGRNGMPDMALTLVYRFDLRAWYLVAQRTSAGAWSGSASKLAVAGNQMFGGGNRLSGSTLAADMCRFGPPPNGVAADVSYFIQSKPFSRESQSWTFANGVNVVFGRGFEPVSAGRECGRLHLWGEQQAYETAPSYVSQAMTTQHPDCPSRLKYGSGKYSATIDAVDSCVYTRNAEFNVRCDVDVISKYVRFALRGDSVNQVLIRGFELLFRSNRGKEVG